MGNAEMTLCNGDSASICQADEGPEPKLRHVGAACKEGDLEALRAALPTPRALRALFRAAQAEGNAAEHTSPLWLAARFGHTELIEYMLELAAPIGFGWFLYHYAYVPYPLLHEHVFSKFFAKA